MGKWGVLVFCLLALSEQRAFSAENSIQGTYRGVLRHNKLQRDQTASLELVSHREQENNLHITAVLKLQFGMRSMGEYVSYVFDSVKYNVLSQTLSFDQPDEGLTIVVAKFKDGHIEGNVRAPFLADDSATLILDQKEKVETKYPLLRELTGTYVGKDRILQLQAFRSPQERQDFGSSPFAENEIRGHLGRVNSNLGGLILDSVFTEGSYDFFNGRMILFGNMESINCAVDSDTLVCEEEIYKRLDETNRSEEAVSSPFWEKELREDMAHASSAPADLSGQYWGYVHHESLNQYQIAGLNIVALPSTNDENFQLSAIASLHFGEKKGVEVIPYKYAPKNYPIMSPKLVFSRPENDAIVQIHSWAHGVLRGIWLSRCFGRVGTFELRKDKMPEIPEGAAVMPSLSGVRNSDSWQIQLKVAPKATTAHSANPFSPLTFGGYFWDTDRVVIPKSLLQGGSYDFFTGRLFLPVTVDTESLFLIGQHRSEGSLEFVLHLSNRFGSAYAPQHIGFSGGKR